MKIAKLEKLINYIHNKLVISVEIEIPIADLEVYDYYGLDAIPDELIPDILVAVGRQYHKKIKAGKIKHETIVPPLG